MKRKITCIITLIVCLAALAGCNKAVNPGFYLFRSSPIGIQIEYPDLWAKQTENNEKIVAFLTPTEGYGDVYRDNVTVSFQEIENGSYDKFIEGYRESLPSVFVGYTEEETADVLVDDRQTMCITFQSTGTEKDENGKETTLTLRIKQYLVNDGDRVYILSFIAAPNSYDYFLPFFNTMVDTFHIKR